MTDSQIVEKKVDELLRRMDELSKDRKALFELSAFLLRTLIDQNPSQIAVKRAFEKLDAIQGRWR